MTIIICGGDHKMGCHEPISDQDLADGGLWRLEAWWHQGCWDDENDPT